MPVAQEYIIYKFIKPYKYTFPLGFTSGEFDFRTGDIGVLLKLPFNPNFNLTGLIGVSPFLNVMVYGSNVPNGIQASIPIEYLREVEIINSTQLDGYIDQFNKKNNKTTTTAKVLKYAIPIVIGIGVIILIIWAWKKFGK